MQASTLTLALALFASSVLAVDDLATRQARGANDLTCVDNQNNGALFTSAAGIPYRFLCSTDYVNGDLARVSANTIDDCVAACDNRSQCVTVVFGGPGNNCFLKQQLVTRRTNERNITAKRVVIPELCNPDQLNNLQFPTVTGFFNIYCRGNYLFGDLDSFPGQNLDECTFACSGRAGCVGATFSNNQCYLKDRLVRARRTDGVSSAIRAINCVSGASNNVLYPTPDGGYFRIQCGRVYSGFDYRIFPTLTIENCIAACEADSRCNNVGFGAGICSLKGGQGRLTVLFGSATAIKTTDAPPLLEIDV